MIEISEKFKCTGCSACFSVCTQNAIEMVEDNEGFKYPKINYDKCVKCGRCKNVCPVLNAQNVNTTQKSFLAINNNFDQRKNSASGGVFSVIAQYVLNNNGIVFGAAYDDELKVKHIAIENIDDLHKLRMSKYVQSDINDSFKLVKEYLNQGKIVLFSGTPCQVAGLYGVIKENPNLILCDIVCHGVPSPKVFESYKKDIQQKYKSKIDSIYFRSKLMGHHLSTISVKLKNGKIIHSERLVKSYPRLWFAGFTSRPSCYRCSFKKEERVSDFTIFDSFKSAKKYNFKDDDYGLSNIYIRTNKGLNLWNKFKNNMTVIETDNKITTQLDGDMILESAKENSARNEFWEDYNKLSYQELIDKYIPYSLKESVLDKMKRFIVYTKLIKMNFIRKIFFKLKK